MSGVKGKEQRGGSQSEIRRPVGVSLSYSLFLLNVVKSYISDGLFAAFIVEDLYSALCTVL